MNWYIVQAYSGFESKVAESIKDVMSKNSMESNLGEILVPTHKVTEVKQGKRKQKQKKYFPGYVLVKLDLNKQIYHKIKNIQKVSGFLGPEGKPVPVSENQIQKIIDHYAPIKAANVVSLEDWKGFKNRADKMEQKI